MSDKRNSFDVTVPTRISVTNRSGDVIVGPSDDDVVTVLLSGDKKAIDGTTIDATPGAVSVRANEDHQGWFSKRVDVLITAPPGGVLRVRIGSGDVIVQLPMDAVDVNTGSGDIRIEHPLNELRAKVASGSVLIDGVVSDAVVSSASGDIRLTDADTVVVNTASGSVEIGSVNVETSIRSASGDVKVHAFSGSNLDIKTMSGDVTVGLVEGLEVAATITTMSGDYRNRIEPSGIKATRRATLRVKSFSGDVTLRSPW
jgi:hypothetical protein